MAIHPCLIFDSAPKQGIPLPRAKLLVCLKQCHINQIIQLLYNPISPGFLPMAHNLLWPNCGFTSVHKMRHNSGVMWRVPWFIWRRLLRKAVGLCGTVSRAVLWTNFLLGAICWQLQAGPDALPLLCCITDC